MHPTSDPTPIVVQPIQQTDGQSVGLLCDLSEYKWAKVSRKELLCRLQVSLLRSLSIWNVGYTAYIRGRQASQTISAAERVNGLHWPDQTAPLRVILSHFAPKRKVRWGQDGQVARDYSNCSCAAWHFRRQSTLLLCGTILCILCSQLKVLCIHLLDEAADSLS